MKLDAQGTPVMPPPLVGKGAGMPGTLARMLRTAAGLYKRGDLEGAEAACRQALEAQPNQPDALHVLGLAAWQRGRQDEALAYVKTAISAHPEKPQPHNSLGVMLRELGDLAGAESAFRTALDLSSDYVEALTNLGNIFGETARLVEAEALHRRVIELAPRYGDGHNNLATVLSKQMRWEDAADECRIAVQLQPTKAVFQLNLGNALSAAEKWEEAAPAYQRAAELAPSSADAHAGLGVALQRLERLEEAAAAHRRAVQLQPDNAKFWCSLGFVEVDLGNADAALEACRRALSLDPKLADAHNCLGMALKLQGRLSEAVAAYESAIRLHPEYGRAYNNLGVALHEQRRFADAFDAYETAIKYDANYAITHVNRGMAHLLLGEFGPGWRDYEHRVDMKRRKPTSGQDDYPAWEGTPVAGKKLLLWSEQGVGDQIMFAGLLPDLLKRGACCVMEADARLEPLCRRTWGDLHFIPSSPTNSLQFQELGIDFQRSLGGLCRWLRPDLASFPSRPGYLKADPARTAWCRSRYRDRFGVRPIVGLSWRGGTGEIVRIRSIALSAWAPIIQQAGYGFVNLQYGDCSADLAAAERDAGVTLLHDDSIDPLKNLDDFAAQVAAMDLVISVDNTTVHMAGALDVPAWVLLPVVPDWRWLLDRDDSPWYRSVRLFRQRDRGDWSPVIDRVADALRQFGP